MECNVAPFARHNMNIIEETKAVEFEVTSILLWNQKPMDPEGGTRR